MRGVPFHLLYGLTLFSHSSFARFVSPFNRNGLSRRTAPFLEPLSPYQTLFPRFEKEETGREKKNPRLCEVTREKSRATLAGDTRSRRRAENSPFLCHLSLNTGED